MCQQDSEALTSILSKPSVWVSTKFLIIRTVPHLTIFKNVWSTKLKHFFSLLQFLFNYVSAKFLNILFNFASRSISNSMRRLYTAKETTVFFLHGKFKTCNKAEFTIENLSTFFMPRISYLLREASLSSWCRSDLYWSVSMRLFACVVLVKSFNGYLKCTFMDSVLNTWRHILILVSESVKRLGKTL